MGAIPYSVFAQIPDYVPSSGLVAWYPFTGNSNDLSGNGRHLSTFNTPSPAADRFGVAGRAYAFRESAKTYMLNKNFPVSYSGYTLAVWVQADSFHTYRYTGSIGAPAGGNVFAGQNACTNSCSNTFTALSAGAADSTGRLRSVHYNSSAVGQELRAANPGKHWFHMVATWNGSKRFLYINGRPVDSVAMGNILSMEKDFYVGAGFYNQAHYYHSGKIDDAGVWSRALSPCEINTLFKAKRISVQITGGVGSKLVPGDTLHLSACRRDSLKVGVGGGWKSVRWSTATADSTIWVKKTGRYSVQAEDSFGCVARDTVWFVNPGKPALSVDRTDSVRCKGGSEGAIATAVAGGFGPFRYQWNDAAKQTGHKASGLKAGAYRVMVSDVYGCADSLSADVYEPSLMYLSLGMNDSVDCYGGSDGALSALASGGTRPYRYNWNDPAMQTGSTAFGLKAGKYWVKVTDRNGCKDSMEIDLKEPDRVKLSLLRSDSVRCFGGSDGSLTVIAAGGNGLYRYRWNDPAKQSTATASGLAKGSWKVWAFDQYQCTDSAVYRVDEPARLRASIPVADSVRCFGASDGRMQAAGIGGTRPYSYLWSDPSAQRTQTAVNLRSGRYLLRINDAKGCIDTISRFLAEPARLTALIVFTDSVRCHSGRDGRAMAQAQGGNGGYQYLWNDQFRQTTALASNLFPGVYRVRVTDRKGCRDSVSATIYSPLPMLFSFSADSVNCFGGSDGSLQVQVQQGRGPFTYSWTDPAKQTGNRAINLRPGTYRVRVTDARGCRDSASGNVKEPAPLQAFILRSDSVNCFGGADGALEAAGSGGSGGYRWLWNDPAAQRTATAVNLMPGVYIATLRDLYGCTDTARGSVYQPVPVRISLSGTDSVRCFGGSDGRIYTTASGGSGGYRWLWNDPNRQVASAAVNLRRGTYKAVVRDIYGCSDSLQAAIAEPERLDVVITRVDQIACFGGSDGALFAAASGGVPPLSWLWNDPAAQRAPDALGLSQGRYIITVRDSKGCTDTASALVRQPAPLRIRITQTFPVSCYRLSDAAANTATSGGTMPYSWNWNSNPPQFTANAANLPAGSYRVVVRDFRGCSDSADVKFDEPDPVSVQIRGNRFTLFGMVHDLEADVLPAGRYQYTWTPESVFGPGAGNSDNPRGVFRESAVVQVIARNNRGCEAKDTAHFTVVLLPEDIMPTAFTPNSDNLNEGFGMPSIFDVEEFIIYDRWGAAVFQSTPNRQRWDGRTASGAALPAASYTYRLKARLKGTQQYTTYTGKVSLIR